MSKRSKKKAGNAASRLSDRYESAILPSYGMGLETFIPGEYSMNDPAVIEAGYRDAETQLEGIADTCDAHSTGAEGDAFVDSQLRHTAAVMESEIAERDYQVARIRSAWEMRKAAISRSIRKLEEEVAELDARIEPLKDLHTQFNLRIGKRAVSIGVIVTLLAFLLDSVVNYSFLQNYLLTNRNLLAITVATMAVMSDGSMWALGTLLSRRHERFVPKGVFITGCVSLVLCFLLSIAATVMIRFGSMDATYGTVNAAGAFVGKASYSLAEYGITLITAFVTTCTGILSFIFSLDENAVAVSRRVRWEAQRAAECPGGVPRPLNLDPGYIDLGKLILASTKDHLHRIYLKEGIFAETTLYYSQKAWQKLPWTYPDYQSAGYQAFLTECRDHLRQLRRSEAARHDT